LARKGQIDLVMVHAKALEEKFVAEGFGTERFDLMYNDFVIVGPSDDPAGIKGLKQATDALKRISEKKALFISRGDNSGTHVAEMDLWKKAGIKPAGSGTGFSRRVSAETSPLSIRTAGCLHGDRPGPLPDP
jgi:tungstate transport system substrate-binding protein